ncbi:dipeptide/oligopeptide/nickel ABC transporter permease/ATP-binding protein [Microbacterium resistens]|uniref:Dipeptide/oligopeptide/nickel ABC transporter permease/ATP-binding protein n=1 Tax=Microbacterium resistens TaxID=156977 RepID=A0ABY3RTD3_9MICO|nr:dipeptide/oligopeptide/nickel ABC transporter permease/ATP-binding protein [Microbacterium resistens]UGS26160.1 dipeptide/oligopeptide/nickel ABC transporter permease/ATP-binding protein [Microbacterium resistens]
MTTPTTQSVTTARRRRERPSAFRAVLRNPLGAASLVTIALIVLLSAIARLIAPYDPAFVDITAANVPPGTAGHLLGADASGRDVLSRLLVAGQLTLAGAAVTVVISVLLGVTVGLLAGYVGRTFDTVASWIADLVLVLPSKIVLVALFAVIGPNTLVTMAVLGVMVAPQFYRLVRNLVMGVKNELYVDAARVSGLSDAAIIARHVLSAVRAPIIIQAAFVAGIAVVIQAGLEFIGLGDPNTPTWGGMLQDAFAAMYKAPAMLIWPGLAIGLFVAACVLLGNAVRDALEGTDAAAPSAPAPTVSTTAVRTVEAPVVAEDASEGALLRVEDLSVGYPGRDGTVKTVVESVSFSIRPGEVLGVVGESGSGKSQTAFSILGLLPPGGRVTGGRILFEDRELDPRTGAVGLRGTRIAYIPQEPMSNLDPAYRIGAQLVEPLVVVSRLGRAAAKVRALALLERVGIADPQRVFDSYPHEISGGMAQRVLIAGAIAGEPDLVIADEPTTALDVTVQAEILDILRDLQRERGMAMMLVTHNFGVVADLCDRVVVMQTGRVVEAGSVADLFDAPRHPYTRMLLGSILDGGPARPDYSDGDVPAGAGVASSAAAQKEAVL